MSRTYGQAAVEVIRQSGSLAADNSFSGSAICHGYAKLVGLFRSDVATTAGSGLIIEQSADFGSNWDYVTASDLIGASSITACEATIFGNAVRVTACNAGTAASAVRMAFYLLPVS